MQDVEEDPTCEKKQNPARGTSKRSRAAEVHNLSERVSKMIENLFAKTALTIIKLCIVWAGLKIIFEFP